MGRIGDLGWAIRDRLSGTAVAVVLALGGLGAGVAGLVIALDAKDKAEEAASTSTAPVAVPTVTAPEGGASDASARVDELNERVAAIEESVAQLRSEGGDVAETDTGAITTPEEPTVPEAPELPEGIELPGAGLESKGSDPPAPRP